MTFTEGQTVRFNVPEEAEYGKTGTVLGETTSPIDGVVSVWVQMPDGHAWLYRQHELLPEDNIRYILAVGNSIAVGVVFTTREKAEEAAKNLRLKYYEVIPQRITKNS